MPTYSPQLIQETIDVFREEDGVLLSENEAVEALDGLAGLFLAFTPSQPTPAPYGAGVGVLSCDLINY